MTTPAMFRCDGQVAIVTGGASGIGLATEMSLEAWNTAIAVNLTGGFLCTRSRGRHGSAHDHLVHQVTLAASGCIPWPG